MTQTRKEKAIHASTKRRFKIGDKVFWITSREGSVKDNFFATGKVTEIKHLKSNKLNEQSNQVITVEINDRGRRITGKLGVEAHSNQFIKVSNNTKGKSFINIRNRFLIDADEIKRKKNA